MPAPENKSSTVKGRAALAAAFLALLPACAEKRIEFPQRPRGLIFWRHIATRPFSPIHNQYRLLVDGPTQGLFPANVGVTRVAVEILDEKTGLQRPVLLTDPRNEFLHWNAALDDLFAVSEVFPISQFDLGGGPAEPEQILAAFRALDARLGLVYAVNDLGPAESEIIGVLYDNARVLPVAYFHTRARSTERLASEADRPEDLWETEAEARARTRFQQMVHDCVRELILQDQPAEVETPTGWRPVAPARPVEWPPRSFSAGR